MKDENSSSPRWSYHGQTDLGRVRTNNEDALVVAPEIGLFGVCDGMGGHAAGEVASRLAADTIVRSLKDARGRSVEVLREAIENANDAILADQAVHAERSGMATTASIFWLQDEPPREAWIGHVGDSRVYLLREGQLALLTEDHTPVWRLYRDGYIGRENMMTHPGKNLIEKALGIEPTVDPDILSVPLQTGDLVLVCSDGLTNVVSESHLAGILASSASLESAARRLIDAANYGGGLDNISVVLVRL